MDKTQYIVKVTEKETNKTLSIELIWAVNEKGVCKLLKSKYKNCSYDIREVNGNETVNI